MLASRLFKRSVSTGRSVGFIGLGQMGYPMASNLLSKSPNVTFWVNDYSKEVSETFKKEHPEVRIAKSPQEVAEHCSVIITMLPASPQVRSVYLGTEGLLHGIKPNTLLIDSSTIDASTSKEISSIFSSKKAVNVLDAPVSGGTGGAKNGTLTFMVGASSEEVFDTAKETLECMGKNIVYCGTVGNGQVAKICNNMLLGISMVAASETMNLGVKMGMDPQLLAKIINTSSGRCWSTDTYNPCPGVTPTAPASRDYAGGFGISLMAKDMGLAVNAARETKSTVVLAGVANQIFNQVMNTPGYEKKDFSSVYRWLKN